MYTLEGTKCTKFKTHDIVYVFEFEFMGDYNLINLHTRLLMCLPGEYDVVLLCTQYTVRASMLCAHLHLYEPLRFALIVTSTTHYLIHSQG